MENINNGNAPSNPISASGEYKQSLLPIEFDIISFSVYEIN